MIHLAVVVASVTRYGYLLDFWQLLKALAIFSGHTGCGAVGRVVVSDTRDPRFESSHRQFYLLSTVYKNEKIKRFWEGPNFFKKWTY